VNTSVTFKRVYGLASVIAALVLSLVGDGHASSHEWLLGVWSGTFSQTGGSGPVTLTIRDEAGTLKWTWTATPRSGTAEAEGIVTEFDASSAEIEGKFTAHWINGYIGTGYKAILAGSPSTLSGSGITARGNVPTTMELTKRK
jgi:hypothetical protein